MRCIFCNKAIPLLRRLSDSQFCSDEHRAAYANEQNLALQRLMTTQVLGKTQRMAAAVPAETRSAAPAVLTIPDGFKTAGAFQAYILDRPLPFQREWNCHAPLEPGHAVVLMDYAPQLRRRFGRLATTVRIPVPALRRRPRPKRSDDPVWTSRAHLPRTASRALPWTYTKPDAQTDPPFVERLRAVSTPAKRTPGAPVTVRGFESQLTPAAPQLSNAVARRKLPAPSGSFAVPQKVAAPAAVPETRPVLWLDSATVLRPAGSGVRPEIPPAPKALEDSPVIELLGARALEGPCPLPALSAAVRRLQSGPDLALLQVTHPWRSVAAPAVAPKGRTTERQDVLRSVEKPAVADWRPARQGVDFVSPDGQAPRSPARANARATTALGRALTLYPAAWSLNPAAGKTKPAFDGAVCLPAAPWIPSRATATGPASPARTRNRQVLPLPAMAAQAGRTSAFSFVFDGFESRRPAIGSRKAARPGTSRNLAAVQPVRQPAPSLWVVKRDPGGLEFDWPLQLPAVAPAAGRAGNLPEPGSELYAVPNAQPMARPSSSKPQVLPMGGWASKPLIKPSHLIALRENEFRERTGVSFTRPSFGDRMRTAVSALSRFRRLPPDLKWIAMAVPLIIGIWVVARPEGKAASAPVGVSGGTAVAEVEPLTPTPPAEEAAEPAEPPGLKQTHASVVPAAAPATAAEPTRWEILQTRIGERASVEIDEDFSAGLSRWEGRGNWARTWSYDRSGTVRPGNLALFEPSLALRDYTLEMKASVDKQVIQWMVRATDMNNYFVTRLNVYPEAAQTRLELVRWAVVKGRAGRMKRILLPYGAANQTLFSIKVEVRGENVTTMLSDQVVDTFADSRLPTGGIGLAGSPGDQARIYGLRVEHQTDFLGKLCSFLAPQPINTQRAD